MGDVSAGFHVGRYADDPNAEFRKVFEERANQQDGLGSILKYCQEMSGFKPGHVDTSRFMGVLDHGFSNVVTQVQNPTTFIKYVNGGGSTNVRDLVIKLPDGSRLLRFMETRSPSGDYYSTLAQLMTEVEGDFLSLYIVEITMYRAGGNSQETVRLQYRSVDRDEMAGTANELVVKLREKERLEDWAKGMSSPGYQ